MVTREVLAIVAFALAGCSSVQQGEAARPLNAHLADIATAFFDDLSERGTVARANFALFIPDGAVHRRYIREFRESLERNIRQASPVANLNYQASAERVFFLPEQRPQNWRTPPASGNAASGQALAAEFQNGTRVGWTILHSYWGELNHLLYSGDAAFIDSLPESLRADLVNPLHYVLRVDVSYEKAMGLTVHRHLIGFSLVEIGTEKFFYSRSFPVILSAKITY